MRTINPKLVHQAVLWFLYIEIDKVIPLEKLKSSEKTSSTKKEKINFNGGKL